MHSDAATSASLRNAVAALAELYQPIYGHPEIPGTPSRGCDDRLEKIGLVHDAIAAHLGRPLRVLDLGCAQGYVSLGLAARGAKVTGIDLDANNIAVCNAIRMEQPNLDVTFVVQGIEERIEALAVGEFDLALGLSVFHHLIHARGIAPVMSLLLRLAETCSASIFEFALRTEPVYWGTSQPENVLDLLKPFQFTHELAWFPTHLSSVARPLFFASNRLWALGDKAGTIERALPKAYPDNPLDYNGTRRYFEGDGRLIKIWSLRDPFWRPGNQKELSHEAAFLTAPPVGFDVPWLDVHGQNDHEIWIVREAKPGQLLREMIKEGTPFSPPHVVQDILTQLTALESVGKYHDDLRTWNVLIEPDGHARLIDYGAIVDTPTDLVWPHSAYLSVITFIRTVLLRQLEPPTAERIPWPMFSRLAPPYGAVLHRWLSLDVEERKFSSLLEFWRIARQSDAPDLRRIETGFTELIDCIAANYEQRKSELEDQIRQLHIEVRTLKLQLASVPHE